MSSANEIPLSEKKNEQSDQSADYWLNHIEKCQLSGLSHAEYCRRNVLKYHILLYWKRKLFKPVPADNLNLVEVKGRMNFASRLAASPDSSVRVWLGDCCIEVSDNFSPDMLSKVVNTLRSI
ncbi:MAG: hypothetical protein GY750_11705 [Lentisphaerae bacterium]|nr:hypothetical protein [Desulfobacteraceae bacterium]MCP4102079.1 hypothetical protein [Lentisphaerota bacterium]